MQMLSIIPSTPTGYVLNTRRGAISVVIPEATTNLVTNPSFETNTTSWSLNGAIGFVRTAEAGLFGSYGAVVTYAILAGAGIRYTFGASVALSGMYTASAYVKARMGFLIALKVNGTTVATGTGLGDDYWVRLVGSPIAINSAGSATIDIGRAIAGDDVGTFTVDGVQLEQKTYATTYCDGDQEGFVARELAYIWDGLPHGSTSQRLATTRSGGKIVNLKDIGYMVLSLIGFGMSPFSVIATPVAQGGAFFQNTITQSRSISLVGDLFAGSELALDQQRRLLSEYLSPLRIRQPQPMKLLYENYDQQGSQPISQPCEIVCHYSGGLEGNRNGLFQERSTPEFQMFSPYFSRVGTDSHSLPVQASVANEGFVVMRQRDGRYTTLGAGLGSAEMQSAVQGNDGYYYVGGPFNDAAGLGGTQGIARWNPVTGQWSAVGTGSDGDVEQVLVLANGTIVAVGGFGAMGGVANTSYIAVWNTTTQTWSSVGTGAGGFGIQTVAQAPNGDIYVGGNFTSVGGVAALNVAKYDGSAWSALGTGAADTVNALVISADGTQIYIAGEFNSAGGVTDTAKIARWSTNTNTWNALSTGLATSDAYALRLGANGALYVGGGFETAGGVDADGIAVWNGTAFSAVGGGIDSGGHNVADLAFDADNNLYLAGSFLQAGTVTIPNGYAVWNGSSYHVGDYIPSGATTIDYIETFPNGTIWLGFGGNGTGAAAAVTAIDYAGTAPSYPTFRITGPTSGAAKALYQLVNVTTGAGIYFNLSLLVGEVVVLDLDPQSPTYGMTSSTRGNLVANILAGSNLADWTLQPGSNDISVFAADSTMTVTISYRVNYAAIEHAVIR